MNYFYPPDQQALFTNRQHELAMLRHYLHTLSGKSVEHVALFGLRRIGKTILLKEFMRREFSNKDFAYPAFLDFSILCSSPEVFSLGFVGSISYWLMEEGKTDPEPYRNAASLGIALLKAGGNKLFDSVQPMLLELQKARPDRQTLLRQAFHFPVQAASVMGKPLVLICDEFQEIRTLEHFPNSRNVLALMRNEMQTQSEVQYILAGSAISILSDLLSHPDSPLFAQFTRIPVEAFDRESTHDLTNKLLSEPIDEDFYPLIHSLTGGHPFYIVAVVQRLEYLLEVVRRSANEDVIKQAFLVETLSPGGRIYDFCQYVYDLSLQKAKGYGVLKSVLQILSQEEGLTATEVSREIHVTPASASDYLRWLCEVDLLMEKEKRYFFHDPVLRFWVANVIRGVEVSINAEPMDMKALMTRLDRQFQHTAEELGNAQESLVRELMRHFCGQTVPGTLFHVPGEIKLPVFNTVIAETSADGQIEIDAVGEGAVSWVVEVKWRNKRAGIKEISQLLHNSQERSATGWCISKAGFSEDALKFARENNILLSNEKDFNALRKMIE